ncbi:MAG: hypothetical protein JNK10_12830 [Cyclobacteriaceae bacterium]|nr:hypothetical protein [Cyclobacteriaceae bacterium]
MKAPLIFVGLFVAYSSFCQTYNVGIVKMGPDIKDLEGQIIITDSTVISKFDGQSISVNITSRKGYTIHVPEGKYVITHASGRVHGFTYDRHVTYHPDKKHAGFANPIYFCLIQKKTTPGR